MEVTGRPQLSARHGGPRPWQGKVSGEINMLGGLGHPNPPGPGDSGWTRRGTPGCCPWNPNTQPIDHGKRARSGCTGTADSVIISADETSNSAASS